MAGKTDSKGDPINRNRRASASASVNRNPHQDPNVSLPPVGVMYPQILADAVMFFCCSDQGYLKTRRSLDSDDLHLTWKWTTGKFAGTYVYVRVEYWRVTFGLEVLQTKVLEVESGERRSTPDKHETSSG